MHPMVERCAGLDVHQATVMATIRIPDDQGGRQVVTETFATTTGALLTLRDWLQAHGVTQVAVESTASIGNRSTTSWRTRSRCCWSTCSS